jgi:hypothetical protein
MSYGNAVEETLVERFFADRLRGRRLERWKV